MGRSVKPLSALLRPSSSELKATFQLSRTSRITSEFLSLTFRVEDEDYRWIQYIGRIMGFTLCGRTRPCGLAFVRAALCPQPQAEHRSTHPASD